MIFIDDTKKDISYETIMTELRESYLREARWQKANVLKKVVICIKKAYSAVPDVLGRMLVIVLIVAIIAGESTADDSGVGWRLALLIVLCFGIYEVRQYLKAIRDEHKFMKAFIKKRGLELECWKMSEEIKTSAYEEAERIDDSKSP